MRPSSILLIYRIKSFNVIDYRCIYECNIFLQADLATAECRVLSLTEEHDSIIIRAEEAESSLSSLKSDLETVNTAKKTETELLARKVRYLNERICFHAESSSFVSGFRI